MLKMNDVGRGRDYLSAKVRLDGNTIAKAQIQLRTLRRDGSVTVTLCHAKTGCDMATVELTLAEALELAGAEGQDEAVPNDCSLAKTGFKNDFL